MAAVASAANPGPLRSLMAPGWIRAAWMTLAGAAFAFALVVGGRAVQGFDPVIDGDAIVTVILLAAPLAFLVGIGGFDYWGRWMIGRPIESGEQCPLSHRLSVLGASAPPPGAIRSRSSPEFE